MGDLSDKSTQYSRSGQGFAALRYRNYRLWFWGQMASLVGTWMQSTAQAYFVYELTKSEAYLGYVVFASGIASLIFMLYAGVVADRMSRRTLMIMTQTAMMVLAFILAGLTFAGVVQPWHIIVLSFLLGIANAFDSPARLAIVTELVDREALTNAIALNGAMFNTATAFGPMAAGLAYAFFGPAWCFVINGLSFIAVIAALLMMRLQPRPMLDRGTSALAHISESLRYVSKQKLILVLAAVVGVLNFFGMAFATLIPAWTAVLLGPATDPATAAAAARLNGYLQSARGAGALISALVLAALSQIRIKGKLLTIGSLVFPVMVVVFGFLRTVPLSLLSMVAVGAMLVLVFNLANALIQELVSDSLRGRVMAIYSLVFFSAMTFGGLLVGAVANSIGAPITVIAGAVISLVFTAAVALLVPQVRALE